MTDTTLPDPMVPAETRPALTERQIARMQWRLARFTRLLGDAGQAERVACRLADRDHDRDDRRMCVECSSYQESHTCAQARRGIDPSTGKRHEPAPRWLREFEPLPTLLARCHLFTFATPA